MESDLVKHLKSFYIIKKKLAYVFIDQRLKITCVQLLKKNRFMVTMDTN